MTRTRIAFRLAVVGISLVLLVLMSACSSSTPTPTSPPPATNTPPTAPTNTPTGQNNNGGSPTATPTKAPTATPTPGVQPVYGGTLRAADRNDPPSGWDTMRSTNYNLTPVVAAIAGDGNFVQPCWDDDTTICPAFAESWDVNSDFTVWTFKIRDGLTWQDGQPMTADDLTYWVNLFVNGATVTVDGKTQTRAPGVAAAQFGDFKSVETLPGNKVQITLNTPNAFYLQSLANYRVPVFAPKHIFQPAIAAGNVNVTPLETGNIGAGPFKFVSYEQGQSIELKKFDNYYEKDNAGRTLPFLDGVTFYIIKDPAAFNAAFLSGQLDVGARGNGYYVTADNIGQYQSTLGNKVYFDPIAITGSALGFNTLKPPFNDIRLREAISLYIDRQSAIQTLFQGQGQLKAGFLDTTKSNPDYTTWPGYNAATKAQDQAKAKQLIADAGAQGLTFTIILPNTQTTNMEWWVGAMQGLGLNPQEKVLDVTAFDAANASGDYEATWTGGSLDFADPGSLIFTFGRKSESQYSRTVHEDPKIDDFAKQLGEATTSAQYNSVLRQFEEYWWNEKYYQIDAAVGNQYLPVRSYVHDALQDPVLNPPTYASYSKTWIDKSWNSTKYGDGLSISH